MNLDVPGILFFGFLFFIPCLLGVWLFIKDFHIALLSSIFTLPVSFGISFLLFVGIYQDEQKVALVSEELNLAETDVELVDGFYHAPTAIYSVDFSEIGVLYSKEYSIDKVVKTAEIITTE